jgi:hypothetical protein
MKPGSTMRVARPTDHLAAIAAMYAQGLGFTVLAEFTDHRGFDGIILGHPHQPYHAHTMSAEFRAVLSYNPYGDVQGRTFEDLDGYRVVLQHATWTQEMKLRPHPTLPQTAYRVRKAGRSG